MSKISHLHLAATNESGSDVLDFAAEWIDPAAPVIVIGYHNENGLLAFSSNTERAPELLFALEGAKQRLFRLLEPDDE